MLEKQCLICSKVFYKESNCSIVRWNSQRQYCSIECKGLASRGKFKPLKDAVYKTCLTCTKEFKVYPYRNDIAKFCSIKCHGVTRVGKNGINWQGGKTSIHKIIRASEQYRLWRLAVFERDKFTCQHCNIKGGKLEADHIKLFSRYPELRFEVSNGQTLCKNCHRIKTTNDLKRFWVNQFSLNTIETLN